MARVRQALALLALVPLTIGAAPVQEELPHCHVVGPFILFFERNSATLDSRSREVLDHVKQIVTIDICWGDAKVSVSGHTNIGERGAIARARAKAARDYLVAASLAPDRITITAHGTLLPRRPGADRENQRVEIFVGLP